MIEPIDFDNSLVKLEAIRKVYEESEGTFNRPESNQPEDSQQQSLDDSLQGTAVENLLVEHSPASDSDNSVNGTYAKVEHIIKDIRMELRVDTIAKETDVDKIYEPLDFDSSLVKLEAIKTLYEESEEGSDSLNQPESIQPEHSQQQSLDDSLQGTAVENPLVDHSPASDSNNSVNGIYAKVEHIIKDIKIELDTIAKANEKDNMFKSLDFDSSLVGLKAMKKMYEKSKKVSNSLNRRENIQSEHSQQQYLEESQSAAVENPLAEHSPASDSDNSVNGIYTKAQNIIKEIKTELDVIAKVNGIENKLGPINFSNSLGRLEAMKKMITASEKGTDSLHQPENIPSDHRQQQSLNDNQGIAVENPLVEYSLTDDPDNSMIDIYAKAGHMIKDIKMEQDAISKVLSKAKQDILKKDIYGYNTSCEKNVDLQLRLMRNKAIQLNRLRAAHSKVLKKYNVLKLMFCFLLGLFIIIVFTLNNDIHLVDFDGLYERKNIIF